jgi:hypothetical protein
MNAPELGSYTFANNAGVAPAIVVQHRNEPVSDRSVQGLEVVIMRTPTGQVQALLGGGARMRDTWQVFLKQHPGRDTIDVARQKIEASFPGARSIAVATRAGGPLEQLSIRIPDIDSAVGIPDANY